MNLAEAVVQRNSRSRDDIEELTGSKVWVHKNTVSIVTCGSYDEADRSEGSPASH